MNYIRFFKMQNEMQWMKTSPLITLHSIIAANNKTKLYMIVYFCNAYFYKSDMTHCRIVKNWGKCIIALLWILKVNNNNTMKKVSLMHFSFAFSFSYSTPLLCWQWINKIFHEKLRTLRYKTFFVTSTPFISENILNMHYKLAHIYAYLHLLLLHKSSTVKCQAWFMQSKNIYEYKYRYLK